MTRVRETIDLGHMNTTGALYRDFMLTTESAAHDALGGFRADAPDWAAAASRRPCLDAALVARMVESNRALGASAAILDALPGLTDGSVRVIVTGQQPGVAGGPLLTLYKIATACALAGAVEAREGVRCIPLFWLGADDDDFEEIRGLAVTAADLTVVSASLPASAYAPGMRVGDIHGNFVREAVAAIAPYLPDTDGARAAVVSWCAAAEDLGDAAMRVVMQLTAGEIAVLDGREPALRTAGRDLLLRFFDTEGASRDSVAEAGKGLVAAGYHAQLDLGDSSGVFLVEEGIRRKIPPERRDAARAQLAADITRASPGVVARNLMQDSVLQPLAVVLGPAEIAYRAQLAGVYPALGVPRPVVFPRMSATFLPPTVAAFAGTAGIDPALFVLNPTSVPGMAREKLKDSGFSAAALAARESFDDLIQRFTSVAVDRLDVRSRDKLEKRFADLSQRLRQALDAAVDQDQQSAVARFPFLKHLPDLFARGGVPQERYLSMLVPYAFHGTAAWPVIRALADESVAAALDGRPGHRVYSV
jgi:hypothetical protein